MLKRIFWFWLFDSHVKAPRNGADLITNFLSLKRRDFIEDLQYLKRPTTSSGGVGGSMKLSD